MSRHRESNPLKLGACPECDAELMIPEDVISGEIISCIDCGMDFEVQIGDDGTIDIKTAEIEGEDWGE